MTQINHLLLQLWDGQSLLLQTLGQQLLVGSLWFYQLLHHSETDKFKTRQFFPSFPNQWKFSVFHGVLVVVFNCNIYDKGDKREIASNQACAPCLVSHVIFIIAFACVSLHVCMCMQGLGGGGGLPALHVCRCMHACECMHVYMWVYACIMCVCGGGGVGGWGGAVTPAHAFLYETTQEGNHTPNSNYQPALLSFLPQLLTPQPVPALLPLVHWWKTDSYLSLLEAAMHAQLQWQCTDEKLLLVTSGGCNVSMTAVAVHWWKSVTCHFWRLQRKHECSGSALVKSVTCHFWRLQRKHNCSGRDKRPTSLKLLCGVCEELVNKKQWDPGARSAKSTAL